MLPVERRPAGLGTRVLTLLVAPFVAVYLAGETVVHLVGRLVPWTADVFGSVLRALRRLGVRIAWRATALVVFLSDLLVEVPALLRYLIGPFFGRLVLAAKSAAHVVAAAFRAIWRVLAIVITRAVVVLRAAGHMAVSTLRAMARLVAAIAARFAVGLRAVLHQVATAIRAASRTMHAIVARAFAILRPAMRLALEALRTVGRSAAEAIVLAARLVRHLVGSARQAIRSAGAAFMAATRDAATTLRVLANRVRTPIRASLRDATAGIRSAVVNARTAIRKTFLGRPWADRAFEPVGDTTDVHVDPQVVGLPGRQARRTARGEAPTRRSSSNRPSPTLASSTVC